MVDSGGFTFAISKGNYPNHVIKALEKRGNWTKIEEDDAIEQADFYWRQVNLNFVGYDRIDKRLGLSSRPLMFNHFEVIRGICTKTNLIKSLKKYYEQCEGAKQ